MASATRNVLTSIALIEGMLRALEANYKTRKRNRTLLQMTGKAIAATQAALTAWPGEIDSGGMKKIALRVGRFESLYGKMDDFTFFSATSLGILEDIRRHIRDANRRYLIDSVISAMWRIHRYFDRNLDKPEIDRMAADAVMVWHRLEA